MLTEIISWSSDAKWTDPIRQERKKDRAGGHCEACTVQHESNSYYFQVISMSTMPKNLLRKLSLLFVSLKRGLYISVVHPQQWRQLLHATLILLWRKVTIMSNLLCWIGLWLWLTLMIRSVKFVLHIHIVLSDRYLDVHCLPHFHRMPNPLSCIHSTRLKGRKPLITWCLHWYITLVYMGLCQHSDLHWMGNSVSAVRPLVERVVVNLLNWLKRWMDAAIMGSAEMGTICLWIKGDCFQSYLQVLQELVMDIMRVLSATDLEVRRKTLNLTLDLVSSRNIDDVSVNCEKLLA